MSVNKISEGKTAISTWRVFQNSSIICSPPAPNETTGRHNEQGFQDRSEKPKLSLHGSH